MPSRRASILAMSHDGCREESRRRIQLLGGRCQSRQGRGFVEHLGHGRYVTLQLSARRSDVADVGLAAGPLLHVPGVHQQHRQAALEDVEHRLPVDASRFHGRVGDTLTRQPVGQVLQGGGVGGERPRLHAVRRYQTRTARVAPPDQAPWRCREKVAGRASVGCRPLTRHRPACRSRCRTLARRPARAERNGYLAPAPLAPVIFACHRSGFGSPGRRVAGPSGCGRFPRSDSSGSGTRPIPSPRWRGRCKGSWAKTCQGGQFTPAPRCRVSRG